MVIPDSAVTLMRMWEEATAMSTYGYLDWKFASYYIHFFSSFPAPLYQEDGTESVDRTHLCRGEGICGTVPRRPQLGGEGRVPGRSWPGKPFQPTAHLPLACPRWPPESLVQQGELAVEVCDVVGAWGLGPVWSAHGRCSGAPRGGGLCRQHTAPAGPSAAVTESRFLVSDLLC